VSRLTAVAAVFAAVLAAVDTVGDDGGGADDGGRAGYGGADDAASSGSCGSQWHVRLLLQWSQASLVFVSGFVGLE
jgi:hypothetical protein